jgi:hypothetical protein
MVGPRWQVALTYSALVGLVAPEEVLKPVPHRHVFLSPRTRKLLAAGGASYLDSTGTLRLALERASVFFPGRGRREGPTTRTLALVSLKRPAAGCVVRALSRLPTVGSLVGR